MGGFWLALATGHAQTTAAVGPSPPVVELSEGELGSIVIHVSDIEDLYAADVRLSFDPEIIEVIDAEPNAPGIQLEPLSGFLSPDWILMNQADNTTGSAWYAASQMRPSEPVSGDGDLARVTICGRLAGSTRIAVTYQKLTHPSGIPIPADPLTAIVHVGGGGPTRAPTPQPPSPTVSTLTATATLFTVTTTPVTTATPTKFVDSTPTDQSSVPTIYLPLVTRAR